MAGRQSTPVQGTTSTASAVVLLLAACFAAPVIAAPNIDIRCDDVADATLEIPVHELKAEVVNHDVETDIADESEAESDVLKPAHYLTPQAEARLQKAFEDASPPLATAKPASDDDVDTVDGDEFPGMNTRVPGVSDSELARYRRQMYRIDI